MSKGGFEHPRFGFWSRGLSVFCAACVLLLDLGMCAAALREIRVGGAQDSPIVTFEFDQDVVAKSLIGDGEVFVQFDLPLAQSESIEALLERLPQWVEGIRYGYDSILVDLFEGVQSDVSAVGNSVSLRFSAIEPEPTAEEEAELLAAQDTTSYRLRRLRTLLRREEGDLLGARSEMVELHRERPEDVQSLIFLAELEARIGRWRNAITRYDQALSLNPGNQAVIASKARLHREHGGRLGVRHRYQKVQAEDSQHTTLVQGRALIGPDSAFELEIERRKVDAPELTRADGSSGRFEGTRLRANARYIRDLPNASTLELGIHYADSGLGGSVAATMFSNYGFSRVEATWFEPYWGLVQGIADQGVVSKVLVSHRARLEPHWAFDFMLGAHRYGIDGRDNAAQSIVGRFSASYTFNTIAPFLSVGYTFDTEHVLTRAPPRRGPQGESIEPLGVSSKEAHSVFAFLSGNLTDYVVGEATATYTIDRFNAEGASYEAALRYSPFADFEMGLEGSLSRTFSRGGNARVRRLDAYLIIRTD